MIKYCRKKVKNLGLKNVELILGDIDTIEKGNHTVLNDIDYIALFNILHCEEPVELLRISYNHLVVNGKAGVIHWKDEKTPRGPSMEIRPKPEQILCWGKKAGFDKNVMVKLPPYHHGINFRNNGVYYENWDYFGN